MIAEKEIIAVCTILQEVNNLPEEVVVHVLKGLTNCSVPEFTKLLDFLLQKARVNTLDLDEAIKQSNTLVLNGPVAVWGLHGTFEVVWFGVINKT